MLLIFIAWIENYFDDISISEFCYIFTAYFYSFTGLWKAISTPSWLTGTFLLDQLTPDLAGSFHQPAKYILNHFPEFLIQFFTVMTLLVEFFFFTSVHVIKLRRFFWYYILFLHLSLAMMWRAQEVSLLMISLQLASYQAIGSYPFKSIVLDKKLFLILFVILLKPVVHSFYALSGRIFDDFYFTVSYAYPPLSPGVIMFSNLRNISLSDRFYFEYNDKREEWSLGGQYRTEWTNAQFSGHRLYWALSASLVKEHEKINYLGHNFIRNYGCNFIGKNEIESFKIYSTTNMSFNTLYKCK